MLNCYMGSSQRIIYLSISYPPPSNKNTRKIPNNWSEFFFFLFVLHKNKRLWKDRTYLQTTQANPISMAKSSALVSSKLERSAIAKSLLVWTVIGEDRVSGFSNLGFFGMSTPSVMSDFIYKEHPISKYHVRINFKWLDKRAG